MKKLTLLIAFIASATLLVAQSGNTENQTKKSPKTTSFQKGDIQINAGIGIIPTYVGTPNTNVLTPPVSLTVGYRVTKNISVNAFGGYSHVESYLAPQRNGSEWYVNNESIMVGLRGEVHTARRDNFDLYGGAMIAYNMPTIQRLLLNDSTGELTKVTPIEEVEGATPFRPESDKNGQVLFTGFVGGSWFFTENVSVFGEVGYGVSIATVGLGYKF